MERCKRRLHHLRELHLHSACLLLLMLWLADGVRSDAANLLRGGVFSDNPIQFNVYPVLDVLAHGIKTHLPYWTCVHGGVQLWDATIYVPRPGDNATFVLHMNSRAGGGHIISVPMYTPRENAEYVVSMDLACNPHGGPRNQSLMAIVFSDEGSEMEPRPSPIILTSNPNSSMENLNWERRYFKMLGTGKCMFLYLVSMVKGYYGLLVANVQVNLATLLENGSFETLALDSKDVFNDLSKDLMLVAPRPRSIPGWSIESGKVKLAMTGPGKAFQSASDGGQYLMELNADHSSGEISTLFVVPLNTSISKNHEYVLLFDTAANPRQLGAQSDTITGSPYTLIGRLGIRVVGLQSNKPLLDEKCEMNSTGFNAFSVGWVTKNYSFKMDEDKTAQIWFRSLAPDISFGPFVDNVGVYEVKNKGEWIKVNTPGYEPPGSSGNDANKHMVTAETLLVLMTTTTALLFLLSMQ